MVQGVVETGEAPANAVVEDEARTAAELKPPVGWQAPLVDLLAAVVRARWLVLVIVGLGSGMGVLSYAKTPYFYKSSVVSILLPREKPAVDVSFSTGTLETGMDAAKREPAGSLMLPPNPELYTALLHSRPVMLSMAQRFGSRLPEIRDDDRSDELVGRIARMLKISSTDDGLLTIEVTGPAPTVVADMANRMVEEMEEASKAIERQLLLQQAGFLEQAREELEADVRSEERAMEQFAAKNRIVDMTMQANAVVYMIREAKTARRKLEDDLLERLQSFTSADVMVETLRQRIAKIDEDIRALHTGYFENVSDEEYGRLQIEYESRRERIRYKRDLLATLTGQATIFRIRAEQPAGSIAVIKPATPPIRPAGPSKKLAIGLAVIGSLIFAVVLVVALEQLRGVQGDPYLGKRLLEMRDALVPGVLIRTYERARRREPTEDVT